jgi:hypothetical protein
MAMPALLAKDASGGGPCHSVHNPGRIKFVSSDIVTPELLRKGLGFREHGMTPQKPLCLFIAPLRGDDSATRERSQDVYASLVIPAAKQAGFFPDFILDDEPGTIMNHIVRSIKTARVVVADLTGNNFSVGYELAFAHMVRKPTIPLIKSGSAMPFDVQTMRAVEYDYTNRGTLRAAIPRLVEQLTRVKRTLPVMIDNPLQNALKAIEPPKTTPPPPVVQIPPPPNLFPLPASNESTPHSVFSPPNSLADTLLRLGLPPEPGSRPSSIGELLKPLDKR